MSMPAFARRIIELEKKVEIFEAYRYSRIGSVVDVTAPDLPLENCMWADGSLALFDLWPELKAKYEKGGFSGLLLPYNCSDEDKKAYPLKWVPDSANPTGLFVPRLNGLFARYCGQQGAGAYQTDAVQTGITGLYCEPIGHSATQYPSATTPEGNVSMRSTGYSDSFFIGMQDFGTVTDHKYYDVNQRFADKTRPENVALPVGLYLGNTKI